RIPRLLATHAAEPRRLTACGGRGRNARAPAPAPPGVGGSETEQRAEDQRIEQRLANVGFHLPPEVDHAENRAHVDELVQTRPIPAEPSLPAARRRHGE